MGGWLTLTLTLYIVKRSAVSHPPQRTQKTHLQQDLNQETSNTVLQGKWTMERRRTVRVDWRWTEVASWK